jgi:hypothetical protein
MRPPRLPLCGLTSLPPLPQDLPYFVALWFTSCVCFLGILGIEGYGLYL